MALYTPQQLSITKIVKFDAAHYLPEYNGKCQRLHGHTWKVEVEVRLADNQSYDPDKDKMLLDFSKFKTIINDQVLNQLDHSYLNDPKLYPDLDYPSAENLVLWIRGRIRMGLPDFVTLTRVRVWESDDSYAEWREWK